MHAAVTGVDARPGRGDTQREIADAPEHQDIEDLDDLVDLVDDVQESTLSDSFKQQAYGEWQTRAAEHPD